MFTDVVAKTVAQDLFECYGIATRLPGEYDYNFHIKTDEGNDFLLKISHQGEEQSILDLQNDVLHKLQDIQLPFHSPAPQRTITGEWIGYLAHPEGQCNMVRLLTYVPGNLFANSRPHTPQLLRSLGRQLGHLSHTLKDFKHPKARRFLKWDLKQASWIREHLHVIEPADDRTCVAYFLAQFESKTAPVLSRLRQSVIHGDINDYNVLVFNTDPQTECVSGFIDFGDLVETSTICELAIALSYAMMGNSDPLAAASLIIEEYNALFPLEEEEIDVLFGLIAIRLCTSVVNSAIRQKENPSDAYFVISKKPAWELLRTVQGIEATFARRVFRVACGLT